MAPKYVPQTGLEYGLSLLGARPDPRQESGLEYGLRQLRAAAGKPGKPETGLQYGMQQLGKFFSGIGRAAKADELFLPGTRNLPTGYREAELAAGQAAANFRPGAGFGGQTPIILGTRDGLTPDRTQSDTYKQYAATPGGQFDRYFKTPEMDQYFGAASRGATAPKDVEAMQALAGKTVAPGKTPEELAGFYRAESAMGRAQMPQIQEGLGYAKGSPLAQWAAANPMLAQRLYAKEMGKREAAGQVTPGVTYAGAPSSIGNENFAVAANAVPAPWYTQGNKVSADFADVKDSQFSYTTGEGMPEFPTTLNQRPEQLIGTVKRDRGVL